MPSTPYRTTPDLSSRMPGGIPYIIGNEAAERFSFYGMKAILVIFMTKYLMGSDGTLDAMSDPDATKYFHLFTFGVYFTPILGAFISDGWLGKYPTIIGLSLVYCLGHVALAIDDTRVGLAVGLLLIAFGAGGIKPCVSAHVGDQFGIQNQGLISKVFGWFYFAINFGAFLSTLLTPHLLDVYGPQVAFAIPGVLMFLATWVFWLGRHKFVHVPPGGTHFIRESFSGDGLRAILNLSVLYVFVAVFWSLYDQTGSRWVLQAENMDRVWLGHDWLSSQIQAANPILILIYIPLFSYVIYPAIERVISLTPLRKIAIGFFLTVAAFSISAWIETRISAGEKPNIVWQLQAYAVLTAAEVMVSITCLEFSYTQAPKKMKSFIMSLYMMSVALGNLFTAGVNEYIDNEDGTAKLEGADYYWFFAGLMLATALAFLVVVRFYRGRTYIQGDEAADGGETHVAATEVRQGGASDVSAASPE